MKQLIATFLLAAMLSACGGTEDSTQQYPFQLSVADDYTVYRNGPLDAAGVSWVIEKDGIQVLERNAKYELAYRYYNLTSGSDFRIWLQDTEDTQVSNVIEFTVDETFNFRLSVDGQYQLSRSGVNGDLVSWVIEQNGKIVLERDASSELTHTYSGNITGARYRAWLQQQVDGAVRRVSNYVEYQVGSTLAYEVSLDQSHRAVRTGNLGEPLLWRISKDGGVPDFAAADLALQWIDYEHAPGSTYQVALVSDDAAQNVVSNTVQYTVDDISTAYAVTFDGATLTRSGSTGDPVVWVVEENGRITLRVDASSGIYYFPSLTPGRKYRFWLEQFLEGGYQRVSNIVIAEP